MKNIAFAVATACMAAAAPGTASTYAYQVGGGVSGGSYLYAEDTEYPDVRVVTGMLGNIGGNAINGVRGGNGSGFNTFYPNGNRRRRTSGNGTVPAAL